MYTTINRNVSFDLVKEIAKALSPKEVKDSWLDTLHNRKVIENEEDKVRVNITLNDNGNIYFTLSIDGYVGDEVKEEVAEYVRQNDVSEDFMDRLRKERASCNMTYAQNLNAGTIKNGF